MKKVRQFQFAEKLLGPDITISALSIGLIDEKGNPTKYAFDAQNMIMENNFSQLPESLFKEISEFERVRTAIRCHFMALPGIPEASMEPIKKQIKRCSTRIERKRAISGLVFLIKNIEMELLQKEHYEDMEHWQSIKSFIKIEAENIFSQTLDI